MGRRAQRKRDARGARRASPPSLRSIERVTASVARALEGGERGDLDAAQDLIYEAFDSQGLRRVELARRALALSADCADAYGILAEEARTLNEKRDLYASGVAAGERSLGRETFEEDAGSFWGLIETRPYMRVRAGLAACLWQLGQRDEAVAHYQELLRLNPGDNQGIRYLLVACLLTLGRDAEVQVLLDGDYADDASAQWMYARALLKFRREGAGVAANRQLAEARRANQFVPAYLTGAKHLPKRMPDAVGFGDESEAIACAAEQVDAWESTRGALDWLRRQAAGRKGSITPTTRRVAVTSRSPAKVDAQRRRWLFPDVSGTFDGIDLAVLDPANPDDRHVLIMAEHADYAEAISAGHDEIEVDGVVMNPRLHITSHEIVCNQLWDGEPAQVWPTVERLRRLGYERHDVQHMLGSVVMEQLYEALQAGRPHDPEAYAKALEALPESWLD